MELNLSTPRPISKGMHNVLLACGYALQEQKDRSLVYVSKVNVGGSNWDNKRVKFTKSVGLSTSLSIGFTSRPEKGAFPYHSYDGMLHGDKKDTELLDILQRADIIDYLALPQAQRAFTLALHEIIASEITDKVKAVS